MSEDPTPTDATAHAAMRAKADGHGSEDAAGARQSLMRHGGGFVVSGLIAFAVDALTLVLLTSLAGVDPFSARFFAIALAMVAGWLSHRRLTFRVAMHPTLAEFAKYAGMAWTAAALNYAVYTGILVMRGDIAPLAAMVAATALAMGFSYLGMRFGVFRHRG